MAKNTVFAILLGVMLLAGEMVLAQSPAAGISPETIVAQLKAQIRTLEEQITKLKGTIQEINETRRELKITRSLFRGLEGDDVIELQQLLAEDPEIYPERLITGYFGSLTEQAVRRFQKKHGIEQVGVFGPRSRVKLSTLLSKGVGRSGKVPLGQTSTSTDSSMGTTTTGVGLITICHIPPGNPANKHTIIVGAPALKAHIAHSDTIGACAGGGNGATTTPDIIPPIISGVSATSTTATTTSITWLTNEAADSKIWYGTTTPVVLAVPTSMASDPVFVVNHSLNLSGLSTSTTYYYIVESKDVSTNTATSSQQSFVTLSQ